MKAGKPQKQSLAIAYSTMRHAKGRKKMADGGAVHERRASADERDEREFAMDPHQSMHGQDLNARDEHHTSIDDASDEREMDMMHKYAEGGPINARAEKHTTIDDARDAEEMRMMDGKPHSHRAELSARDEHHVGADDSDSMEMDMMHKKLQADEYSKEGISHYATGGSVADAIMAKRKRMAEGGEADLQDSNGDEHLNYEDDLSFDAARKKTYYDLDQLEKQPHDSNEHGDDIDSDEHDMVSSIRRKMKK